MSRRYNEGNLFVGRLSKHTRSRDLEQVFESYGRVNRCELKYGAEMAYAFVDFDDRRDAEDALRYENGRDLCGSRIIIEWAKGNPRRSANTEDCYKCHRGGHWARDCPEDRYGRGSGSGSRQRRRSPPRRRSRSRSRDRRRRSRSRSHHRRSPSPKRRRDSPSRSRSVSKERSKSREDSRSRSRSKSQEKNGRGSESRSRSRSRSK